MPRFDGTGPSGLGPMTGRGMGNCEQVRGYDHGQGFGRGFGRGRGDCYRFADSAELVSPEERIKVLKAYKEKLEAEIDVLEKRLK